jgi:hypothetical protein
MSNKVKKSFFENGTIPDCEMTSASVELKKEVNVGIKSKSKIKY